jgi:hypothetical protein
MGAKGGVGVMAAVESATAIEQEEVAATRIMKGSALKVPT